LADPIEYIRGIVASFVEYQYDKTTSIVRLGISGAEIVPNYTIETPCEPVSLMLGTTPITKHVSAWRAFNGRNHQEFSDPDVRGESWSSEGMTFYEVQALLGQLRESKKKKR
jgi:hypothetical protein